MQVLNSVRLAALGLLLVALPWQTHLLLQETILSAAATPFGAVRLYAFDLLAALVVLLSWVELRRAWQSQRDRWELWLLRGLGVLVAVVALGSIWALEPALALAMAARLALIWLLIVVLITDLSLKPFWLLAGLAVGMVAPSVFAWMQSIWQLVPASTWLGVAAQDPAIPGTAVLLHEGGRWLRAYGSLSHPNIMGGMAAIGLVAAVIASVRTSVRWQQVALGFSSVAMGGALVLSGSRSAWIAAAVGLGWLHVLVWPRVADHVRVVGQVVFLCGALTALTVGVVVRGPLQTRLPGDNQLEERSVEERVSQWSEARSVAQEHLPLLLGGVGAGQYVFALEQVMPGQEMWDYQPVHSVPWLVLLETGLVGAGALIVALGAAIMPASKRWQTAQGRMALALVAALVPLALFDHYMWTQPTMLYTIGVLLVAIGMLGSTRS